MKTTSSKTHLFGAFVSIIVSLAIVFVPVMQSRAENTPDQGVEIIQIQSSGSASTDAAVLAAEKDILKNHPGYELGDVHTLVVHSASTDPAAIKAAVAKALADKNGSTQDTANPNLAPECVIAVLVIIVGTIIIIKLIHLCQKVLPTTSSTNSQSSSIVFSAKAGSNGVSPKDVTLGDTNVYAACIVLGEDNSENPFNPAEGGKILDIPFSTTTNGMSMLGPLSWESPSIMVPNSEFQSQLAAMGLTTSTTSYSSNGVPMAGLPNIQWINGSLVVKVGNSTTARTNVFQSAPALSGPWTSFFTNVTYGPVQETVSDGNPPAGSCFYRVMNP